LEFNVPFQHKYGHIRDETTLVMYDCCISSFLNRQQMQAEVNTQCRLHSANNKHQVWSASFLLLGSNCVKNEKSCLNYMISLTLTHRKNGSRVCTIWSWLLNGAPGRWHIEPELKLGRLHIT